MSDPGRQVLPRVCLSKELEYNEKRSIQVKQDKITIQGKPKIYRIRYGNLPEVEYEVLSPEVAVEAYRTYYHLSPDRPYKSYIIKEVKND